MRRTIMLLLGAFAFTAAPSRAAGQTVSSFELGLAAFEGDVRLAQVGWRVASAKPNALGLEFAAATSPQILAEGVVAGALDFSLTAAAEIQCDVLLVGRGGASVLGVFGGGGAEGVVGYHAGVGVVARGEHSTGARLDYTIRYVPGDYGHWSVSSLTLGIVWYR